MLRSVRMSLRELAGDAYADALVASAAFFRPGARADFAALADEAVDFYPAELRERLDGWLDRVGERVAPGLDPARSAPGAATRAFDAATRREAYPLACLGPYRVGEDGRLYFAAKSEHYHAPLGHAFPGYRLLEIARQLGVANASHNNQRGFLTRLLEQELVAAVRPAEANDGPELARVINLETGSLAVEAGLKMMLARFYALDPTFPAPKYAGRTPVFFVVADHGGGRQANYHGTTVTAQTLRGLWPDAYARMEAGGAYRVEAVAINDAADFRAKLARWDAPPYKVAGFLHEIVLMNYAAILLREDYLRDVYAMCRAADVPVLVDEIQSCLWYDGFFLFNRYGLRPDFVAVGKGFPGGEYAASKILVADAYDTLNQFGALVTNGQEELASLAYLVTMAFARANGDHTEAMGARYRAGLEALAAAFPDEVVRVEGLGLLAGLVFRRVEAAAAFAARMNARGVDVSAQTYKADCPPAALTKLPLICSEGMVDFVLARMREALAEKA